VVPFVTVGVAEFRASVSLKSGAGGDGFLRVLCVFARANAVIPPIRGYLQQPPHFGAVAPVLLRAVRLAFVVRRWSFAVPAYFAVLISPFLLRPSPLDFEASVSLNSASPVAAPCVHAPFIHHATFCILP
jgi:hypothetical protein